MPEPIRHLVPMGEALRYWFRLGFVNFGGPAGQIALMHEDLVVRKRWIGEERFLHALNYCMLLPGPEAQQLAIYVGWLLNGAAGGIAAGVFFVLPAFFLILGLSWTYVTHGDVSWVAALFYGLQAAVVALVAAAVLRVGGKALRSPAHTAIAVAAFAAIFVFHVAFPLIVAGAAVAGLLAGSGGRGTSEAAESAVIDDAHEEHHRAGPSWRRSVMVIALGLAIWWLPLLAVIAWRGAEHTLSREAVFFSQAAMVTFGGAYAVLSYIDQAAVQRFGWLTHSQMVTGLGLAESTPGPLIMVTEFVGFVAAYQNPGSLAPLTAGVLGALVTVWATFAPCFLWIFLGAPFIERLRGNRALDAALSGVTAAVVGVIANLAVTFGLAVLFGEVTARRAGPLHYLVPEFSTLDGFVLLLAAAGFIALWRRAGVLWVVGASAAAGLIYRMVS